MFVRSRPDALEALVELVGAAGIGSVIGWLVALVRSNSILAIAESVVMTAIVGGSIWIVVDFRAGVAVVVAAVCTWVVHSAWRVYLARRVA
jgi:hypothetical protein